MKKFRNVFDDWWSHPGSPLGAFGGGGSKAITTLTLTCTTTGAQTLTLNGLTIAAGKTVSVDWGDTNSNTYTAGAGTRTHNYAGAGTWTVVIHDTPNVTLLDLRDLKLSCTIDKANPLPSNLTSLRLYGNSLNVTVDADHPMPSGITYLYLQATGFTWTVSASAPMPTGLTYLYLFNTNITWTVSASNPMPIGLTELTMGSPGTVTWTVSATAPMPTGLTYLFLQTVSNLSWTVSATAPMPANLTYIHFKSVSITWSVDVINPLPANLQTLEIVSVPGIAAIPAARWAINSLASINIENNLTQPQVDAVLEGLWTNKANFTYASPSLDLFGTGNKAPSGVYQTASPPTTGMEYAYDLVNGTNQPLGPEWTITICEYYFSLLGDSITATNAWPNAVYAAYKSGHSYGSNHAVASASIMAASNNMDEQTVAAANDTASGIIIELGTNDDNAGDMVALQAEFEENIAELKISNPAASIFVMGILPRWTDAGGGTPVDKSNIRTAEVAAATAQAVTYWDTLAEAGITAADTSDGTHLIASGNTKLANFVVSKLPA